MYVIACVYNGVCTIDYVYVHYKYAALPFPALACPALRCLHAHDPYIHPLYPCLPPGGVLESLVPLTIHLLPDNDLAKGAKNIIGISYLSIQKLSVNLE